MARFLAAALALAALAPSLVLAPGASAQVQPYGTNDNGYFNNVLPPGQNGFDNALALAQYEANKTYPPHNNDQLQMYSNLTTAAPNIRESQLNDFYKDATFGVPAGEVAGSESPEPGVTIVRDAEVRCAARLWRHPRRADVRDRVRDLRGPPVLHRRPAARRRWRRSPSSPAAATCRWTRACGRASRTPTRTCRTRSTRCRPPRVGRRIYADITGLRRGDQRVHQQGADRSAADAGRVRGNRAAAGPQPFSPTDLIRIATLVGGIFGKGGGNQLNNAVLYENLLNKFRCRARRRRGGAGTPAGRREGDGHTQARDSSQPAAVEGPRQVGVRNLSQLRLTQ